MHATTFPEENIFPRRNSISDVNLMHPILIGCVTSCFCFSFFFSSPRANIIFHSNNYTLFILNHLLFPPSLIKMPGKREKMTYSCFLALMDSKTNPEAVKWFWKKMHDERPRERFIIRRAFFIRGRDPAVSTCVENATDVFLAAKSSGNEFQANGQVHIGFDMENIFFKHPQISKFYIWGPKLCLLHIIGDLRSAGKDVVIIGFDKEHRKIHSHVKCEYIDLQPFVVSEVDGKGKEEVESGAPESPIPSSTVESLSPQYRVSPDGFGHKSEKQVHFGDKIYQTEKKLKEEVDDGDNDDDDNDNDNDDLEDDDEDDDAVKSVDALVDDHVAVLYDQHHADAISESEEEEEEEEEEVVVEEVHEEEEEEEEKEDNDGGEGEGEGEGGHLDTEFERSVQDLMEGSDDVESVSSAARKHSPE
eukprot:TRINITY_DN314_c0_g6_i2.p2 TRINITY_DN314_c0_g6~~TRINITY_DN314_c0_g6_i2.p2  ORF type:complete len:418 (-),score=151.15 TRINITY_DN314_c0_g6_i2:165-1418(-)